MTESTTIQISVETKAELDKIKNPKEPYDRVLRRILKQVADNTDSRYVTLKMTPPEFIYLRNRQTWPECDEMLISSRQ
jgi:hypothetical protein